VTAVIFAILVILLPTYLMFQVVNDVVLRRKKFFTFFEILGPSQRALYTLGAFVFVLSLWSLVTFGEVIDPIFLPTPLDTVRALWTSFSSGELFDNALVSVLRILVGFSLASLIGISLGSVAGTFARLDSVLLRLNSAVRYIPSTAFIGLTIIWFGIGESSKIVLIFIAIVFYIIQMVADTVRLVPKVYIEAAQMLGANRWEVFSKTILSMSTADLLAVLRVNLGAAWTFLIVAELVSAQKGLGYLMAVSQRYLQTPKLFALIVFVGVLGFLTDSLLALAIHRIGKWKANP
jgi:NitT/TauT family transport system permease protein